MQNAASGAVDDLLREIDEIPVRGPAHRSSLAGRRPMPLVKRRSAAVRRKSGQRHCQPRTCGSLAPTAVWVGGMLCSARRRTRGSRRVPYEGGAAGGRAHRIVVAAWWLFLATLFLLAIGVFVRTPGFDSSVYLYVAEGLLEGELPYRDRWDHKPPLIFLINVVGLLLADVWGI